MRKPVFAAVVLFLLFTEAFAQSDSPDALRSQARALTVGDLLGLAESAGDGDIHSQLLLGVSYRLIAERDLAAAKNSGTYHLAAYWLRQAADKGSAPAQYFLADLELDGPSVGLTFDCGEVSKLISNAVAQQYLPAMIQLGHFYIVGGCGFKRDISTGLEWFRKASRAGYANANYWLGRLYEEGREVRADQREANRWFLKGARMGDAACQDAIGISVAEGNGTRKNGPEAVQWFRKSAEQGNPNGACNLSIHYIRGEGIERDYVAALVWALISDRNITGGVYCLDHIEIPKLSKSQVAAATQQANAWLTAHHYPTTAPPEYTEPKPD